MRRNLLALILFPLVALASASDEVRTRNVVLVTIDGLRWQEVFRGADAAYNNEEFGGVSAREQPLLRERYLAETPAQRREILMPFFWTELSERGQLFGNRDIGSSAEVTNPVWISYPGYNELLTGVVDPLLLSNVPLPNRNVTILEWLESRPEFSGRVAASTSWDVFSGILHAGRNKFPHWFSGGPPKVAMTPRMQEIERWMRDLPKKSRDEHFDAFAFHAAMDFLDTIQPRMLYLALGEADTNGHARRYDKNLDSITRSDRFLRELWEKLQSMPQYRGSTTLIVTTDHGRGATPDDWKHHRNTYPHSNETWLAVIGPDTPALGERGAVPLIKQTQVAATVARLLGVDYRAAIPDAGEPIAEIFASPGFQ